MGLVTATVSSLNNTPQSKLEDEDDNISLYNSTSAPSSISSFNTDDFYERLINEAPYIPGDKCELIPVQQIPWADTDLLKQGTAFVARNLFSIIIANTAALMYGFSVKPESVVLLRSGKFHKPENSFRRYLSTARRIGSWFRSGLSNTEGEGYKNIQIVRSLHSYYAKSDVPFPSLKEMDCTQDKSILAKAIRDDLEFLDTSDAPNHLLTWDPPLPFSQFDMALTQFGFIGLVYLYPKSLGISDLTYLDGFMHFWAVVGRMLGLEDRFNLALHPDRELLQRIYDKVGLASLKSTDETVICLQHALIEGLSRRLPLLTLKGWIYYGLKEEGNGDFKGENLWELMSFSDKACYYSLKWSITLIHKFVVVRFFANVVSVLLFELAHWLYLPKGCPYSQDKINQ